MNITHTDYINCFNIQLCIKMFPANKEICGKVFLQHVYSKFSSTDGGADTSRQQEEESGSDITAAKGPEELAVQLPVLRILLYIGRGFEHTGLTSSIVFDTQADMSCFAADLNFCPECGNILPLPGLQDTVRCPRCSFSIPVAGTGDRPLTRPQVLVLGFSGFWF